MTDDSNWSSKQQVMQRRKLSGKVHDNFEEGICQWPCTRKTDFSQEAEN
jgi:hypothetical protein